MTLGKEPGIRPTPTGEGSASGWVLVMGDQGAEEDVEDIAGALFGTTDDEEDVDMECKPCNGDVEPREPKIKRPANPADPTPRERERHYAAGHLPYRPWCPICVKAKAHEDPHYKHVEDEMKAGIPEIAIDYASIMARADGKDRRRILVGKDRWTKAVFCHTVKCKGMEDPHIVQNIKKSIDTMGHAKITLTTDGEPAIIQVQQKVQDAREHPTVPKNPPAYDPQSNGMAEKAVGDVKAEVRAIKLGLESRIGKEVSMLLPVMEWIIRHAPSVINRVQLGVDGRTSYYRIHHRDFSGKFFEFGEQVLIKPKRKIAKQEKRVSMKEKWLDGTWLGWDDRTGEHLVAIPSGPVVRVRSVRPVAEGSRWSAEAVEKIIATPNEPNPKNRQQGDAPPAADIVDGKAGDGGQDLPEPVVREDDHREFRITSTMLERFGYSRDCVGCTNKRLGLAHRGHTDACRQRLEEAMNRDARYKEVLTRRDQRLSREDDHEGDAIAKEDGPRAPTTPRQDESARVDSQVEAGDAAEEDGDNESKCPRDSDDELIDNEEDNDGAEEPENQVTDDDGDDEPPTKRTRHVQRVALRRAEDGAVPAAADALGVPLASLPSTSNLDTTGGQGTNIKPETQPKLRNAEFGGYPPNSYKSTFALNPCGNTDNRQKKPSLAGTRQTRANRFLHEYYAGNTGNWQLRGDSGAARAEHRKAIDTSAGGRVVQDMVEALEKDNPHPEILLMNGSQSRGGRRVDVAEVYSPPRMTAMARTLGLRPGFVADLTLMTDEGEPWDLSIEKNQDKAIELIAEQEPWLLVLSPPCTAFSSLQNLNKGKRDAETVDEEYRQAIKHVVFAAKLCRIQLDAGRRFMIEHPVAATSWSLQCLQELINETGVKRTNFDFCMVGMQATDQDGEGAAKKRTGVLSNSEEISKALEDRQCDKKHRHVVLTGGKAKACEVYPDEFCELICTAAMEDKQKSQRSLYRVTDVTREVDAMPTPHEDDEDHWTALYRDVDFFDDVTGCMMDKDRATEARKLEIKFFKDMEVYKKVPRSEAHAGGYKVISTRWLDVNKGDKLNPDYRARLVGRELNTEARLDLFAATPPLESLKLICSICASHQDQANPYVLLSVDVKRAYFYAKARRPIYIEIPVEDYEPGDEHMVGRLNLSLYGTRDAAQNWSKEYTEFLEGIGFVRGKSSPCNFVNPQRNIYLTVHGDDFTLTGNQQQMEWVRDQMKAKYEIKDKIIGPAMRMCKEARILNRTIRWTNEGIEYEPDRRHADLIIKEVIPEGAKSVTTPGTDEGRGRREESPELTKQESSRYRGIAARLNYLALDRPDLQNTAKCISKHMARPREADWVMVKRVARYLVGSPRSIQMFEWQCTPSTIVTYGDSDWTGKERDRKSTSGGVVIWGSHTLKSWSSQQKVIALSSGEAELYAVLKAATQTKGIMSMFMDFGLEADGLVMTDANAAMGIVHRQGLGKMRHLDVQYLWIQQEVSEGRLRVGKVRTTENVADLLTKNLPAEAMHKHLHAMKFRLEQPHARGSLRLDYLAKDQWDAQQSNWTRVHHRPRATLFTPFKVANGPGEDHHVGRLRVTRGIFADGTHFEEVDEWRKSEDAHRRLRQSWIGSTEFMDDYANIDDECKHGYVNHVDHHTGMKGKIETLSDSPFSTFSLFSTLSADAYRTALTRGVRHAEGGCSGTDPNASQSDVHCDSKRSVRGFMGIERERYLRPIGRGLPVCLAQVSQSSVFR